MNSKIALIILAAGQSERMGKIKQLLPWKKTTLLGNSIEQAINSKASDIYVVLGSDFKIIKKTILNYNISIIYNDNWENGMGTSISVAINRISKNHDYHAVIVVLADQPFITSEDLNVLIQSFKSTEKGIVSTRMKSKSGVPAIIDKKYFAHLKALDDLYGAKFIINENIIDNLSIDLSDHYLDIDTLEDYQKLFTKQNK